MADPPQAPQPDDGPEVYHGPTFVSPNLSGSTPHSSYYWEPTAVPELKHDRPAGHEQAIASKDSVVLTRRTFWGIVILSILVLGGALGGGISGGIAIQKSKSQRSDSPTTTVTVTVASANAGPSTTTEDSTSSTTTSSPSSISTYQVLAPSAVPKIDNSCPSSDLISSYSGETFTCYLNYELREDWITGIVAYNMQACVDACSNRNEVGGTDNKNCVGVQLAADMQFETAVNNGANCWLSSSWGGVVEMRVNLNWTTAILCTSGDC